VYKWYVSLPNNGKGATFHTIYTISPKRVRMTISGRGVREENWSRAEPERGATSGILGGHPRHYSNARDTTKRRRASSPSAVNTRRGHPSDRRYARVRPPRWLADLPSHGGEKRGYKKRRTADWMRVSPRTIPATTGRDGRDVLRVAHRETRGRESGRANDGRGGRWMAQSHRRNRNSIVHDGRDHVNIGTE